MWVKSPFRTPTAHIRPNNITRNRYTTDTQDENSIKLTQREGEKRRRSEQVLGSQHSSEGVERGVAELVKIVKIVGLLLFFDCGSSNKTLTKRHIVTENLLYLYTEEDILKKVENRTAAVPIHFYCLCTKPMHVNGYQLVLSMRLNFFRLTQVIFVSSLSSISLYNHTLIYIRKWPLNDLGAN